MNTLKIAALYTRYTDVAQLLDKAAPDAYQALLPVLLVEREDKSSRASYEVRVRHFGGLSLDQSCPLRVYEWANAQLPVEDLPQPKGESWSAMTAAFTGEPGGFLLRYGSAAAFAPLLRGMRHYQRKLNRRTKKLFAQLRAYHAQQLAAEVQREALVAAASTSPLLPHYGITRAEYGRRLDAADDLALQMREKYNRPDAHYGYDIMWHPDFPAACVESFSQMDLSEVEYFLSGNLAKDFYRGQPLDYADYAYLADCLREGLADSPTPLAALRLTRALTWAEQAGAALLPTAPPVGTGQPVLAFSPKTEQGRQVLAEAMEQAQGFATL